jgi:hypothetical protein
MTENNSFIPCPDQPKDAPKAVFGVDPRLDRTHTQEMNAYLKKDKIGYEKVVLESVHGVKTRVRVPLLPQPYCRLIEIDDEFYER